MKCDQCEMLSINGVACHELGCPNRGKVYRDGVWSATHECPECGTVHDDYDDMARCCQPDEQDDRILLVDECSGIYVPVRFARWAQEKQGVAVLNVTPADLDELARGPDVEGYWDLWDEILRDVEVIDVANGGQRYTLYQDGDLWLVPA